MLQQTPLSGENAVDGRIVAVTDVTAKDGYSRVFIPEPIKMQQPLEFCSVYWPLLSGRRGRVLFTSRLVLLEPPKGLKSSAAPVPISSIYE